MYVQDSYYCFNADIGMINVFTRTSIPAAYFKFHFFVVVGLFSCICLHQQVKFEQFYFTCPLFIVPRSLEVCDSCGFQFVAKLARTFHSCNHPLELATRRNLKKPHHLHKQKIARFV